MSQLVEKPRWVNKMKTVFQRIDVKRRGYITREDWLQVGERLREKSGLALDDPKATAHRSALSAVYDELRCGKEKLTAEEFLECASNYCAQQVTSRRKQQTTSFMTMTNTLFQALDANDNGYLTPKEWEGIFYMWNYPDFETIAVEAFKAADKSKDGKISPEEFQQFGGMEGIFYMWNYQEFETIAVEAFKAADNSKDEKISPEEFQQFGFEFWMTDEDEFDVQGMCGPDFEHSK